MLAPTRCRGSSQSAAQQLVHHELAYGKPHTVAWVGAKCSAGDFAKA